MQRSITFTIIVCSKNRGSRLSGCLEYLTKITYRPNEWELILVDNGSTDNTKVVFDSFSQKIPAKTSYLYQPIVGLAHARNLAVAQSTGDVLLFIDDDCYSSPTLLQEYRDEYTDNTKAGFIGGQVKPYRNSETKLSIQEKTDREYIATSSFLRPGLIHGTNMSIRRSLLLEHGSFDTNFGAGSQFKCAGDTEILARLSFSGTEGLYSPRPLVWHDHGNMSRTAIQRVRAIYSYGRGAYYMKMILNPDSRSTYIWHWAIRILQNLCYGRIKTIFGELQGAIAFYRCHSGQEYP